MAKQAYLDYPQLDGLFCATDRLAVGAIKALQELGVHVGQQVKLLGVGNDELAYVSNPLSPLLTMLLIKQEKTLQKCY